MNTTADRTRPARTLPPRTLSVLFIVPDTTLNRCQCALASYGLEAGWLPPAQEWQSWSDNRTNLWYLTWPGSPDADGRPTQFDFAQRNDVASLPSAAAGSLLRQVEAVCVFVRARDNHLPFDPLVESSIRLAVKAGLPTVLYTVVDDLFAAHDFIGADAATGTRPWAQLPASALADIRTDQYLARSAPLVQAMEANLVGLDAAADLQSGQIDWQSVWSARTILALKARRHQPQDVHALLNLLAQLGIHR